MISKQGLSTEQLLMVQSEFEKKKINKTPAYLLWFFLGTLGVHRFFIGDKGIGITQLALTVVGWLTAIFLVGFIFLGIVGIWLLVDIFMLSSRIDQINEKKEMHIIAELRNLTA